MGELLTPNLGLIKPIRDVNTPLDIDRLNLNMDRLDDAARVLTVTDTAMPPAASLWDGKIVREKTTGKVWIAEKQTNGSFLRRWINYPWMCRAHFTLSSTIGMQGVGRSLWTEIKCPTVIPAHCMNSSQADIISGGRIQLPITGLYLVKVYTQWHEYGLENTTGSRMTTIGFNGSVISTYSDEGRVQYNCGSTDSGRNIMQQCTNIFRSGPGTDVSIFCYQNSTSGGTGPLGIEGAEIEIALIAPDPAAV
jgi:hypothetical protein